MTINELKSQLAMLEAWSADLAPNHADQPDLTRSCAALRKAIAAKLETSTNE